MNETRRTALVTGASAGIGKAFAEELACDGFDLVLTARRSERLHELKRALEQRHGVRVLTIPEDLADPAGPARLHTAVVEAGRHVDVLVNNAGYGVPGTYATTRWESQRDNLQVLVQAVAELSHRFLPGMIDAGYGRIINVASLAGLVPGSPGHTLYGASKAFVIKFSEALAAEVRRHDVHVTAVCPGFTYSEFHDVTGLRDKVSRMPSFMWMDARTVARQSVDAAMRGEAVYVNGLVNRLIAALTKHSPHRIGLRLMQRSASRYRDLDSIADPALRPTAGAPRAER